MRKILLMLSCLLLLPALALAQDNCNDCLLGLFDEIGMVNNFGAMGAGTPKDIYVGLRLGAAESGITGIEFSIAGIRQAEDGILVLAVEPVVPTTIVIGTAPAPADTTTSSTGTGGLNIAWSSCVTGSQALVKISLLSFAPVTNKVFRVKRKYPPGNPAFAAPLIVRCDAPNFTKAKVPGGCYIAGYTGTPLPACPPVGVDEQTWSNIKGLFR